MSGSGRLFNGRQIIKGSQSIWHSRAKIIMVAAGLKRLEIDTGRQIGIGF